MHLRRTGAFARVQEHNCDQHGDINVAQHEPRHQSLEQKRHRACFGVVDDVRSDDEAPFVFVKLGQAEVKCAMESSVSQRSFILLLCCLCNTFFRVNRRRWLRACLSAVSGVHRVHREPTIVRLVDARIAARVFTSRACRWPTLGPS